ncbi:MAG TPA: deoxyribose-phosphate aldolase [Chthonomonadales bacterium]|nr:deoxyribose-phosphate aldolase [Chthonomonadales bacterium]
MAHSPAPNMDDLARCIDSTLLRPQCLAEEVVRLCEEASEHRFAAVCILPGHIALAAGVLAGASPVVCTVVGFPLGAELRSVKEFQTDCAIQAGAKEIDMVMDIPCAKAGDWVSVGREIERVVNVARPADALVKVIIECAYLTEQEKKEASGVACESGAHFVKTSTGFATSGATVEDVRLLANVVDGKCGVKASGGIRDLDTALKMLGAGATRLGLSAAKSIMQELGSRRERL